MPGFKPGPHWWEASTLATMLPLLRSSDCQEQVCTVAGGKLSFMCTKGWASALIAVGGGEKNISRSAYLLQRCTYLIGHYTIDKGILICIDKIFGFQLLSFTKACDYTLNIGDCTHPLIALSSFLPTPLKKTKIFLSMALTHLALITSPKAIFPISPGSNRKWGGAITYKTHSQK